MNVTTTFAVLGAGVALTAGAAFAVPAQAAPAARTPATTVAASTGVTATTATSTTTTYKRYANCTALHARYKHGVGLPRARDHVRGTTRPVTTFYRNKGLYLANTRLDRDKDGIACEKR